jgi:stage III sporulation protein SpoIIIAA
MALLEHLDDLELLFSVLPDDIRRELGRLNGERSGLTEIVLDLGRPPLVRLASGDRLLLEREISLADIDAVKERIGDFGGDNRAGISGTLHRISAIRNRAGSIVGLTVRIGRVVPGAAEVIADEILSGRSILVLGRPGAGKTTILREAARLAAERRRVVIVDTSNEIAGDGDVPHPAIGSARRMQVANPSAQHAVMIEAVENHMPEVIVIDEIGTEEEARAARTIAERGVQLIGTAHGTELTNLLVNPTLSDLVGGVEAVTLGDDEARKRGSTKTVLERKSPPTFSIVIELLAPGHLAVYPEVDKAVDALLRGTPAGAEERRLSEGELSKRWRKTWADHARFVGGSFYSESPEEEPPLDQRARRGRDRGRERRRERGGRDNRRAN